MQPNETLSLMRDRISKQECPICGTPASDSFKDITDEYITKDTIKICSTHRVPVIDSK